MIDVMAVNLRQEWQYLKEDLSAVSDGSVSFGKLFGSVFLCLVLLPAYAISFGQAVIGCGYYRCSNNPH
jgi:hypothetical protein